MSFTRAKNPVKDSGFNLRDLSGTASTVVGWTIFLTVGLVVLAIVRNQVKPWVLGLASRASGGRVRGDSGGAWEGW